MDIENPVNKLVKFIGEVDMRGIRGNGVDKEFGIRWLIVSIDFSSR